MSKYLASFTPYDVKQSLVRVTGYDNKCISGYIENPYFENPRYFDNLTQFFLIMENLCDEISYPQRTNESRALVPGLGGLPDFKPQNGEKGERAIASFRLNILFRQNSSWQGSVLWLEKQSDAQFRSALELVLLMDGVLSSLA